MKKPYLIFGALTIGVLIVSALKQKQDAVAAAQPQSFTDRAEAAFKALWPW